MGRSHWAGEGDSTEARAQGSLAVVFPLTQEQSLGFEFFSLLAALNKDSHSTDYPLVNNSLRILIYSGGEQRRSTVEA